MIDIHCHILPYVDDGSDSMEDSLEMARMAAASGITSIIATPHCNLPYAEEKNYRSQELARRFLDLQHAIQDANIPLRIYPGAEILCTPEVPELLQRRQLLTLAGSNYLLTEFFFDESLDYMDQMLSGIESAGYIPVIAHPERYETIQRTPHIVERWFRNGWVIQLNKGSILGRLGHRAELTADWILAHGLAHIVASDAHSPRFRTTDMTELTEYLQQICQPEYVDILLDINPERILNDLPILQAE